MLLTSVLWFCFLLSGVAQTISIGGNQYAFQYSGNPNFGLFFNQNSPPPASYEFKDDSGNTVWSTGATTGHTWVGGNLTTVGNISPGGALQVGGNKYAFQYSSNNDYGLLFNSSTIEYQFMTNGGLPVFSIGANDGFGNFSGGIQIGNTSSSAAGTLRWTGADLEVNDG